MVSGRSKDFGLAADRSRGISRGEIDGIDVVQIDVPYENEYGIWSRTGSFLKYAIRSVRFALREDYDLLFATSTPLTAGIPGIVTRMLGRRRPFVFEVRDLWPELPRALGLRNPFLLGGMSVLEKLSYQTASACVGLSPGICDGIRRRAGAAKRIVMIPNSADLEVFRPGDRSNLRIEGVKPTDLVAAFTGAHGIANGLNAVLDAAAELLRRNRDDIKLLFIGDGRMKPKLQQRAMAEGLGNCVFVAPMSQIELSRLMGCIDVGLMILANVPEFYYGTSPNKFFDYIAAGLPVLNNYPGWLSDIIQRHQCGLTVPPEDPVAFADALCELAEDSERRRMMGDNSRKLAETEFNRGKLGGQFVSFLEEVWESAGKR
jgi:glycosyltransferase involved in cell wall biosynthesis